MGTWIFMTELSALSFFQKRSRLVRIKSSWESSEVFSFSAYIYRGGSGENSQRTAKSTAKSTRCNKGKGINNKQQKEAYMYVRAARLFTA